MATSRKKARSPQWDNRANAVRPTPMRTFTIDPDAYARITEMAQLDGTSRSGTVCYSANYVHHLRNHPHVVALAAAENVAWTDVVDRAIAADFARRKQTQK